MTHPALQALSRGPRNVMRRLLTGASLHIQPLGYRLLGDGRPPWCVTDWCVRDLVSRGLLYTPTLRAYPTALAKTLQKELVGGLR